MSSIVYSLWIQGPLNRLNKLAIESFKANGHKFIIYSFDKSIEANCEVRDANDIMPEDQVYFYKHLGGNFRFGGIAERLKSEMLYQLGGWHVDLDVVCLQPFNMPEEYVLRPHPSGVVGNIIKAPVGCELGKRYVDWTRQIDANNTDWEKSFRGLTYAVSDLGLQQYIVDKEIFGTDEEQHWRPLLNNNGTVPPGERKGIHFCGAMGYYNNYQEGSFYDSLLKKYNI